MKAVSVYLKQKLKEQLVMFPPDIMPCACCCVLEYWKSQQIFLNRDVLLNGSWVDLDGTLKWSLGRTVVVQ